MKDKFYYLKCDVYNVNIFLYIGKNKNWKKATNFKVLKQKINPAKYNSFIDEFTDIMNKDEYCDFCYEYIDSKHQNLVICVQKLNLSDIDTLGVFIHECLHASMFIALYRGMVETEKSASNEALTYLHEWIVTNLLHLVKDNKKYI